MLLKLAWRNIWRNKRKSFIVLSSVIVGMIAVIFYDGLDHGMLGQMLNNQISNSVSHIQIHKKGFNDNKVIKSYIPDNELVENVVKNQKDIKAYSKRVITFGLLSSASSSSGVYIYGVYPEMEAKVSDIKNSIIEGHFFNGSKRDIVIGKLLADKLGVGIGDKVVVMSNTPNGNIGSDLFRVAGIFQTVSTEFDKTTIYIPINTAQEMLGLDSHIYEYAIILNDYHNVDKVKSELESNLNSRYEVLSYKDLLPMLIYQMDLYDQTMWIFYMIVGLALIFGIVNTMLMSVFERINEIGVLMAIGMKNSRIFLMFVFEAFLIGVIGTIVGLVLGLLIHWPISISGINFSIFSDALKSFGIGAVIYPVLSVSNTIVLTLIIPFIAVIGALYPAYRAIKLEPIKAIYYV
jgi:putative ABC transport system permease protein